MNIDSESNLLNKKVIYDLTAFSHLDYPDHLSCIIWISGCPLRCQYCYNKDIVFAKNGKYSFNDILDFLDTRVNLLDGVVLSGGEATSVNLVPFCKKVKQKGFKIKLDTSGVNFKQLKQLVELNLVDYIALDYKAPRYKFQTITNSTIAKFKIFEDTLKYLIKINFNFEVRTTVHTNLLDEVDINFIIDDLVAKNYNGIYYLQNYLNTNTTVGDIGEQDKPIDIKKINSKIVIKYRNY